MECHSGFGEAMEAMQEETVGVLRVGEQPREMREMREALSHFESH